MVLIKTIKTNILPILLGISIILFTLWNRIIRNRLPKNIEDFGSHVMLFIICINILILGIILFTIVWTSFRGVNDNKGIIKTVIEYIYTTRVFCLFHGIATMVTQSPKTVYQLIFENVNVSHILEIPFVKISRFFIYLPMKYTYILTWIHMFFCSLPKGIPPIIFLTESIFFNELNYFYKSIIIYIIPLSYKILIWILIHLADHNINFATAHIDITYTNKDEFFTVFKSKTPDIQGAVDIVTRKFDQKLLDWFVYIYDTYVDLKWLPYRLDLEAQKLTIYERIFSCSFYLIGWSYILIKNLSL